MAPEQDGTPAADASGDGSQSADNESSALGPPSGVSAASMAVEIAELKAELETLKGEADKRLEAWQRTQADLENYKRRALQEMSERVRGAQAALLLDFLAVVDDFERAIAADHATDPAAWVDGVRLIEQKLYQFLEQKDLAPIAAEQQPFDPNFHEAIGQAPGPAGQILAQVQKGYLLGDRVLRPARVIVGAGQDDEEGDEQQDDAASDEATEANSGSPEPG